MIPSLLTPAGSAVPQIDELLLAHAEKVGDLMDHP